MDDLGAMKERMKSVWALGDYPAVARRFEAVAQDVVAACRIGPGMRVLDIAAGNGNAAIAAARAGADVTASDFTPSLVAAGRERTAGLGLAVAWDEADAEDLPYGDGAFAAVTSTFGLMFAPRPEVAVAEAFRVLKPGGVAGITAWTPDGFTGQVTALMSEYLPAPWGAARPIDWGIEATVRSRLAPQTRDLELARDHVAWEFATIDETITWQEANFGALVAARAALDPGVYGELRDRLIVLMREWNRARDGGVRLPAAYLRIVARKPASPSSRP